MDPITLLGAIASIIEIANFIERSAGGSATRDAIERVFHERAADPNSPEARTKRALTASQLEEEIDAVINMRAMDKDFLDRIDQKCLPPYKKVVASIGSTNIDVEEAYAVARKCICENIGFARRQNGGAFPNAAFKRLWDQFNCPV
jgi:hypothetical protein